MHECVYKIWVALALHLVEWSGESTDFDPIQTCWRETHGRKETDSFFDKSTKHVACSAKKNRAVPPRRVYGLTIIMIIIDYFFSI